MHAVWYNPAKQRLESDIEARHHELQSFGRLGALLEMFESGVIEP